MLLNVSGIALALRDFGSRALRNGINALRCDGSSPVSPEFGTFALRIGALGRTLRCRACTPVSNPACSPMFARRLQRLSLVPRPWFARQRSTLPTCHPRLRAARASRERHMRPCSTLQSIGHGPAGPGSLRRVGGGCIYRMHRRRCNLSMHLSLFPTANASASTLPLSPGLLAAAERSSTASSSMHSSFLPTVHASTATSLLAPPPLCPSTAQSPLELLPEAQAPPAGLQAAKSLLEVRPEDQPPPDGLPAMKSLLELRPNAQSPPVGRPAVQSLLELRPEDQPPPVDPLFAKSPLELRPEDQTPPAGLPAVKSLLELRPGAHPPPFCLPAVKSLLELRPGAQPPPDGLPAV